MFLRGARLRFPSILRPETTRRICGLNPSLAAHRRPSSTSPRSDIPRRSSSACSRPFSTLQLDPTPGPSSAEACQGPSIQRTKSTLVALRQFSKDLDPASATDADLTFLLQYLKPWPVLRADFNIRDDAATASIRALGHQHAQTVLGCLAEILAAESPPDPHHLQRVVKAWPDVQQWVHDILSGWCVEQACENLSQDHVDAFYDIIPLLTIAAKAPSFADTLIADDHERSRKMLFVFLLFCWLIETEACFMKHSRYNPSISAADAFTTLVGKRIEAKWGLVLTDKLPSNLSLLPNFAFFPGFEWLEILDMVCVVLDRTPADIVRIALTHVRSRPVSLDLLFVHLEMISLLSTRFRDFGIAQHSIRDVMHVLSELTLTPYDAETAPTMAKCIGTCVSYLNTMTRYDHPSCARAALLRGILPAILRCKPWVTPDSAESNELLNTLDLISLYLIYPSVLHPFLASARKIEELGLVDNAHSALVEPYQEVIRFAEDRLAMVQPTAGQNIYLGVKCRNCGKHDIDANFEACSGCFLPSYCSEACQTEHWIKHEEECKIAQALREDGLPLPLQPDDVDYLGQFTMVQVNRNRAEIVRVWKEEQPARAPLVSFDFSEDPNGVMVVGERCLDTTPGAEGNLAATVSARWREVRARPVHDEDAIVCIFVPQRDAAHGIWMSIGVEKEFREAEGTVLERLVKSVEGGLASELGGPLS
ncbi:hypothetical protein DFH09DRAFT_1339823 [Mycena vulgaris]|nr:hypothetical protein DFH09DRAFT_1339823 [Mycena vulgaris]